MDLALSLTDTQTTRLRRVAAYEDSTTYEIVFLALEEYLSSKEDERIRSGALTHAAHKRELLRSFVGTQNV